MVFNVPRHYASDEGSWHFTAVSPPNPCVPLRTPPVSGHPPFGWWVAEGTWRHFRNHFGTILDCQDGWLDRVVHASLLGISDGCPVLVPMPRRGCALVPLCAACAHMTATIVCSVFRNFRGSIFQRFCIQIAKLSRINFAPCFKLIILINPEKEMKN